MPVYRVSIAAFAAIGIWRIVLIGNMQRTPRDDHESLVSAAYAELTGRPSPSQPRTA